MGDDGEVVGHEQVGEAALAAQIDQKISDLRLHRHVQRGGRLVQEHDLGLQDQGAGDRHPLPLPAGQLVGVAVAKGGAEPHLAQGVLDAAANAIEALNMAGLAQDPVDGVPGCSEP